ncbi:Uncharacterised protein [Mycobacteroides abscessus subsp. abscessus]|nr:Uncharacterised protein [Mycobacteroides abscessus subsp. abscessus]
MPKASASRASAATASRRLARGKREPQILPSGPGEHGPVEPSQPPSILGHTTKYRSVSMARPGPIRPSHQPGRLAASRVCSGASGPTRPAAAWVSPVRACSTSTAFEASGASSPHVS